MSPEERHELYMSTHRKLITIAGARGNLSVIGPLLLELQDEWIKVVGPDLFDERGRETPAECLNRLRSLHANQIEPPPAYTP